MPEADVRILNKALNAMRGEGLGGHLVRASAASIGLKIFYTLSTMAVAVILARVLGADGYGIYSYAYAITTLLAIPAQVGLPTLLVRNVAAYQVAEQWGLMRGLLVRANQAVLAMSLGLALAAAVVTWLFWGHIDPEQRNTFAWALVLLPLAALGNLRGAVLRGLRRVVAGQLPEQLLRPGLLVCFLLPALLIPGAGGPLTPSRAMALHVLAASVAFAAGAWLLLRALPPQVKTAEPRYDTRAWARSVLPLSFLAGMQVINNQTDIIILGMFAPAAEVGVYRAVVQGAHLVAFILTAMNMVLGPNVARLYAAGDRRQLQRVVTWSARVILLTSLPVALVFIIFGNPVLGIVFGAEYARGHLALAILCLGQLVNAGMGSVGLLLNMTGHERDTAAGMAAAAAANVLLNLILIPFFGMEGAAAATAASLAIWNLLLVRAAYRRTGIVSVAFWPERIRRAQ